MLVLCVFIKLHHFFPPPLFTVCYQLAACETVEKWSEDQFFQFQTMFQSVNATIDV